MRSWAKESRHGPLEVRGVTGWLRMGSVEDPGCDSAFEASNSAGVRGLMNKFQLTPLAQLVPGR